MSENIPEIPLPAPPTVPTVVEVPVQPEAPQQPAEPAGEPDAGEEAGDTPQAASVDSGTPTVVSDDSGVRVEFPDGRTVTTRQHPFPVSNSEWEKFELTHSGDQARYSYKPGDPEYSPYADPSVPNSQLAQQVEREIQGYAERVLVNPDTPVSSMWEGLQPVYQGQLEQAIATGGGDSEVEA